MGPVLEELGFTQEPSEKAIPRVWWVGSGFLNILPIHAAGYHDFVSTQSAIDRVISSYTPSIKAVRYARERYARVASLKSSKALLVGMPETPNEKDLPFVVKEIRELNNLLSTHIRTTVAERPSRKTVIEALPDHQIAHFSCHGYLDAADPSKSRLLLNDLALTVSDFTSMNIPLPQLAFLSACHSATMGDFRLLNESINLSSAIQLAGYPSAIGTLWEVTDNKAAEVAKNVYTWMLEESDRLNTALSAEALHHAVRALRESTCTILGFIRKQSPTPWSGPLIYI